MINNVYDLDHIRSVFCAHAESNTEFANPGVFCNLNEAHERLAYGTHTRMRQERALMILVCTIRGGGEDL
jgi:hypothetical protein